MGLCASLPGPWACWQLSSVVWGVFRSGRCRRVSRRRRCCWRSIVRGGKVTEDDRVLDRLAGDAEPTAGAIAAAVCVNDDMFLTDVTLRPVVVVSSSSRFLRLAELLAAGEVDAGVAGAIEALLFEDPGLSVSEVSSASGVGPGAVEDYLDATSQAPSAESADRFVVFIASRHLDKQRLFIIDREGVDYSSLELSDKTSFTTLVFVDGGWVEVDAGPDDCASA